MFKPIFTVLFILFSWGGSFLISQVEIDGVIKVGDEDQMLLLETVNGDQFIGSVSVWEKDTLVFRLAMGSELVFPEVEVKKISPFNIDGIPQTEDYSFGEFNFKIRNGGVHNGEFVMMNKLGIRLKQGNFRREFIRNYELEKVTFSPYAEFHRYPNHYKMKLENGSVVRGHLLSVDPESVQFKPYDAEPFILKKSAVLGIYKKSQRARRYFHIFELS